MIRRRILAASLAGWLVAACGQTAPSTPPPEPTAHGATVEPPSPSPALRPSPEPPDPTDSWAQLTSTIERDGTVSLDTALAAFALLIGPLPGVETPAGDPPRISSGSGPIRWLLGHWDELSTAQRDAVEALLRPDATTARLGGGSLVASLGGAPLVAAAPSCPAGKASPRQFDFDAKVLEATGAISAKLGRQLTLPVAVVFHGVSNIAAETVPLDAACRPTKARPGLCQIQVTNRGEGLEGFEFAHIVAHEVFHCFQYDLAKTAADAARVAPWLAEGSAAWVGEVVSGGSTVGAEYWENWLKYPWWPLFSRSYDGIGFFMHLQESGVDPWPILIGMHRQGEISSADAYAVAVNGGAAGRMLDAWGPSYIRDLSLRPDWSTGGSGLPDYVRTPIAEGGLGNDETAVSGAAPLAADALKLNLQADSFVIEEFFAGPGTAHGLVRFADGTQRTLEEAAGKPFCTRPGGCSCPTDSPGAAHDWQSGSTGPLLFGLAGDTDGIDVWLQGLSVDTTCAQAPEDFLPAEPCWCPPGPLGSVDVGRPRVARALPPGARIA